MEVKLSVNLSGRELHQRTFDLSRHWFLVGFTLFSMAIGCAESDPTQQVKGEVTYQGKPLDHGLVSFFPVGAKSINAAISPEGKYETQLLPGEYQVIINSPPQLPQDFKEGDPLPPPDPNALPAKYSRQQSSGLFASIKTQEGTQNLDFNLK